MSSYEILDYDVLLEEEAFEIRKYLNFFIVEYENDQDPEMKRGFSSLYSYISKDNKDNQKISMTTPVIRDESENTKKIAFVAPAEFGDDLPEPNNPNLKRKKFDEGLFAVIRYPGFSNKDKEFKMRSKLERWLEEKGCLSRSIPFIASYNAPFAPLFRRNEIWIRVSQT